MKNNTLFSRIWSFLLSASFGIMMVGFFLAIVGLLLFMRFRHYGNWMPVTFTTVAIVGFVLYFIGRVLGVVNRNNQKKRKNTTESESDDEDN